MSITITTPHDPRLPQLGTILSPTEMARHLDDYFNVRSNGTTRIEACVVDRVKYRPRKSCTVSYRLRMSKGQCNQPSDARVYGNLFEADEAHRRFPDARAQGHLANGELPAIGLLSPVPMIIWHFPVDRKLSALHTLSDANSMMSTARTLVETTVEPSNAVRVTGHELVSYFPEHTCTVRVQGLAASSSGDRPWTAYAKTRYDDAGVETFRLMGELQSANNQDKIGFAQPLLYQHESRTLWQAGVDAAPLADHLDKGKWDVIALERVALALARLHSSQVHIDRRIPLSTIIAQLYDSARLIELAAPHLASNVHATVATLIARADDVDPTLNAVVHGDLHSHNILLSPEKVVFIDLDRVSNGMALAEVGSLLAEFTTRALLRDEEPALSLLRHLFETYATAAHYRCHFSSALWHCAAALIHERARRCVTSLKPGRFALLPRVIFTAQSLLAHSIEMWRGTSFTRTSA